MAFAYIVRCNFTEPAREPAWNAWYGGPKIAQMLSLPYFRTCQRFRRVEGTGRNYLALWTVLKAEAMTTPEYRSQWGFSDWAPCITDWSRDLFEVRPPDDDAFAVPPSGALHVVSFDGMDAERASAGQTAVKAWRPGMMWLPIAGLDRHTPLIGLRVLPDAGLLPPDFPGEGIQEAIYRPLSEQHKTATTKNRQEKVS